MSNDYFQFKQFKIEQDQCAMKVGTDGVLLGAWTDVEDSKDILDIGAGTGLISLMLAQRAPEALITGLEIDTTAANQATSNIQNSPFNDRIELINADIKSHNLNSKYDLIVCNPPFFSTGTKSPSETRNTARHDDYLSYALLLSKSASLLNKSGKLSVVIPLESLNDFQVLAKQNDLYLKRRCDVFPNHSKPSKRVLLEYICTKTEVKEEKLILEEQRHNYTEEAKKLFKDFYLSL